MVDYSNQGQRKLVWRSSLADARADANGATDKITEGQGEVLNLKSADAHSIIRARAVLNDENGETRIDLQIDEAVREFADAYRLAGGRITPIEAVRDWLKRHAVDLPKITVADAVGELKKQAGTDGKSDQRKKRNSFPPCWMPCPRQSIRKSSPSRRS